MCTPRSSIAHSSQWNSPEAKTYLAGLGVKADELLENMNAQTNIPANPVSRDFLSRFGDVRGKLSRPVLTMKNTFDGQTVVRHESAYRASVDFWGQSQSSEAGLRHRYRTLCLHVQTTASCAGRDGKLARHRHQTRRIILPGCRRVRQRLRAATVALLM
jgi:hypothetical protein